MNKTCYNIFGRICYCKTNCISCQEGFTIIDPLPFDLQAIRQCRKCVELKIHVGVEVFKARQDEDELNNDIDDDNVDPDIDMRKEEEQAMNIESEGILKNDVDPEIEIDINLVDPTDEEEGAKIEIIEEEMESKIVEATDEQEEEAKIESIDDKEMESKIVEPTDEDGEMKMETIDDNNETKIDGINEASGLFAIGGGLRIESNKDESDEIKSGAIILIFISLMHLLTLIQF